MPTRVDGSLQNLVQGVSQQSARDRLAGQCTDQINCVSDPVRGLARRAPSVFISALAGMISDPLDHIHTYDRGDKEKYIMAVTNGAIQVYDLEGNALTVGGVTQEYLTTPNARGDISLHTIGDYTFISNKQISPAMLPTNALDTQLIRNGVLFTVDRPGSYGQSYTINVDGNTVTYKIPNDGGTSGANLATWGANRIIKGLGDGFNVAGYTVAYQGNTLYIYKDDETDVVPIAAEAESGSNGLDVFTTVISTPLLLPTTVPHGLVIQIAGGSAEEDDYFLRSAHSGRDSFSGGFDQTLARGYWLECADPRELNDIDPLTMPHAIVRMPDGTFHFGPLDGIDRLDVASNVVSNPTWSERLTGDDLTNTTPSFIGVPINGMFSFQGRFGLLAGENLIASQTDNLFSFWKKSATALLDTDRIDITSNSDQVSTLSHAVQHNRNLVVFSENAQFVIAGRVAFRPATAALNQTTVFDADLLAQPLANGQNILFGINYGQFAGVREFFTDSEFDTDNAEPITRQVERYMPGRIENFAGSTDYNAVVLSTDEDPRLFLYQYLWAGAEKVQSSWSAWDLSDNVVHAFFVQSELYLVKKTDAGTHYLTSVDLRDVPPEGLDFNIYLDRRTTVTATTTGDLPIDYPVDGFADLVAIQGNGCPYPGLRVAITNRTGATLTFDTDMAGGTVLVGTRYTAEYIPTMPQVKDKDGNSITQGALTITSFVLATRNTGELDVYMDTDADETFGPFEYTSRIVGGRATLVGAQPIIDGLITVPFQYAAAEAELRITSDSHLPFGLTDIEWRGRYKKRGRRI